MYTRIEMSEDKRQGKDAGVNSATLSVLVYKIIINVKRKYYLFFF